MKSLEKLVEDVKANFIELKNSVSEESSKKLDLKKCERIIEKLSSISINCEECKQRLVDLNNHLIVLKENTERIDFKQHKQIINNISSHLQKEHKLIPEGYYLAIYMCIGLSMGVSLGLTLFQNFGLGMPIGMALGVAIGAALDSDAKKKGKTI